MPIQGMLPVASGHCLIRLLELISPEGVNLYHHYPFSRNCTKSTLAAWGP